MRHGVHLLMLVCLATWGCSDDVADTAELSTVPAGTAVADDAEGTPEDSDMDFVHGSSGGSECGWIGQEQQEGDDPTTNVYTGTLRCRSNMSDARVSGIEEWVMVAPSFYTEFVGEPHTGRFEASTTLETDDGVWRGNGFGADLWSAEDGGLRTTFYVEYVGEGAYDGLVYRAWGAQHPESGGYSIVGYVRPVD